MIILSRIYLLQLVLIFVGAITATQVSHANDQIVENQVEYTMHARPSLEITTAALSAGLFLSGDENTQKGLSMSVSVGFFASRNFEPILAFKFSHYNYTQKEAAYRFAGTAISTTYSIFPGLAFNFSKDNGNSFVLSFSPGLIFSSISYDENYINRGYPGEINSTQFGFISSFGKRFRLAENVSWYPYFSYEWRSKNDTILNWSNFEVVPGSISILL